MNNYSPDLFVDIRSRLLSRYSKFLTKSRKKNNNNNSRVNTLPNPNIVGGN